VLLFAKSNRKKRNEFFQKHSMVVALFNLSNPGALTYVVTIVPNKAAGTPCGFFIL
jgi:hypothetical protein